MLTQGLEGPTVVIFKGESKTLRLTVLDQDRQPVDLDSTKLTMTVKNSLCDNTVIFDKDSDTPTEIAIQVPSTNGIANIMIDPADTADLEAKDYVFDIWVELSTGEHKPVIKPGIFKVERAVTVLAP